MVTPLVCASACSNTLALIFSGPRRYTMCTCSRPEVPALHGNIDCRHAAADHDHGLADGQLGFVVGLAQLRDVVDGIDTPSLSSPSIPRSLDCAEPYPKKTASKSLRSSASWTSSPSVTLCFTSIPPIDRM